MDMDLFTCLAVLTFSSIALIMDLKTHRIPNWLTVSAAAAGAVYHTATSGMPGTWFALGGFGAGFGVLLVLWLIGGGGGGDVKLMGAIGAWLGALPVMMVFVGSALFAILCAVALAIRGRKLSMAANLPNAPTTTDQPSAMKQTIPYALPVSMAIWTLFAIDVFC